MLNVINIQFPNHLQDGGSVGGGGGGWGRSPRRQIFMCHAFESSMFEGVNALPTSIPPKLNIYCSYFNMNHILLLLLLCIITSEVSMNTIFTLYGFYFIKLFPIKGGKGYTLKLKDSKPESDNNSLTRKREK